jgi:hypothetical protein
VEASNKQQENIFIPNGFPKSTIIQETTPVQTVE